MSENVKTIIVKYCGGCNPLYDRVELVRRVEEALSNSVRFTPVGEEKEGDAVLVVSGCHVRCAGTTDLPLLPMFSISSPEELPGLIERIRGMLEGRTPGVMHREDYKIDKNRRK